MPYREGQKRPTLPGFLASPIVNQVIRKRLFGGAYIRFVDSFIVLYTLYMMGAVLGRARRNQFDVLVKMLTLPEANVSDYVQLLQKYAKNRLSKFVADVGKEPSRFDEFIFFREINNALSFQNLSLDDISQAYLEGNKNLVKILHMPVPVTKVVPVNEVYQQEALGFGSLYPELTEKMYRNNMEKIDMDAWAEMRAHGATFPEKPVKVTLEEEERIILQWLAIYAAEYYPELLNSLNLKDYLDNSLS